MGRLKGKDLATFAVKCKLFRKVGGTPRQIQFVHNSHADGDETYRIITEAYSDVMFDTMSGLTRRDWTFKTNTEAERDEMFADLQQCMAEYNAMIGNSGGSGSTGGSTAQKDDPEDEEKKSGSLVTYIVIGAAAAIIIALLIPWKKK